MARTREKSFSSTAEQLEQLPQVMNNRVLQPTLPSAGLGLPCWPSAGHLRSPLKRSNLTCAYAPAAPSLVRPTFTLLTLHRSRATFRWDRGSRVVRRLLRILEKMTCPNSWLTGSRGPEVVESLGWNTLCSRIASCVAWGSWRASSRLVAQVATCAWPLQAGFCSCVAALMLPSQHSSAPDR